jgi:2-(1,2-epoxy-1,2-dihydrophenyl)acetyl-CoA isomerase
VTAIAPAPPVPELETLSITDDDGVGILTLDRPEDDNAMSPAMLRELPVATAWLRDESPFSALVVTGAGRTFSLGGDLSELERILDTPGTDMAGDCMTRVGQLNEAILNLRAIERPVVAAVNGLAAGSGFALALACDDRVASDRAAFTPAYGKVGLSPDGGLSYLLPRLVGELRARALLLNDELVRAERALAEGIVSRVVAPDQLLTVAVRRARRIGAMAPHYVTATKRLLAHSLESTLEQQLEREREAFAAGAATDDFRRGLEAHFAGRRATFAGD